MFTENNNNILSSFIKYKLKNTKFPKMLIWKEGVRIAKGVKYIYDNKIWLSKKEGLPNLLNLSEYFDFVKRFSLNDLTVTDYNRFTNNSSYYDSNTHYYLNNLFRLKRDLNKIDLLSMSNIWDGKTINNLQLSYSHNYQGDILKHTVNINKQKLSDVYDLMIVNIKANVEYSLYFESDLPIILTSIGYDGKNQIGTTQLGSKVVHSCRLSKPIIYKVIINDDELLESSPLNIIKDHLTLLIQIPKKSNPRIILEGNYNFIPLIESEKGVVNYKPLPNQYSYFSELDTVLLNDLLIGYIVDFFITKEDELSSNIEYIQTIVNSLPFNVLFKTNHISNLNGIYGEDLQLWVTQFLNKYYTKNITGFVDKRMEQFILKGEVE